MVSRTVVVVAVVLVLLALGFYFFSNMTGNVVTSGDDQELKVESEYFKICETDDIEEDLNDTQNNSGSG